MGLLLAVHYIKPLWLYAPKPVKLTEEEIRAELARSAAPESGRRSRILLDELAFNFVLAPTNFFAPDSLRAAQQSLLRDSGFRFDADGPGKAVSIWRGFLLPKAMVGGWLSWDTIGITPGQAKEALHHYFRSNPRFDDWFELTQRAYSVGDRIYVAPALDDWGLARLRWLREVDCLDLVDREKLIEQLRSVQILSGRVQAGRSPPAHWRSVRGLFFTPGWPVLQDTYCSLTALELLGGLDRIDREACIRGILRRHVRRGYFAPPEGGGYNEYKIRGDARDTFCAFESLRILGAVDRVKDLDRWQFRPEHTSKAGAGGATRRVGGAEIEAWVCQQRLERFLRERRENPRAPARSLLEP
jgi:hypothetical protein